MDAGFTEEEGRARQGEWLGDPRTFRQPFVGEKGLAVLLASSPGYTTYEDPATRRGVFTRFLMEFRDKTVDRNQDGLISVREISTYVPWKVNRWAQGFRNGKMSNPLFLGSGILFRLAAGKPKEKRVR